MWKTKENLTIFWILENLEILEVPPAKRPLFVMTPFLVPEKQSQQSGKGPDMGERS